MPKNVRARHRRCSQRRDLTTEAVAVDVRLDVDVPDAHDCALVVRYQEFRKHPSIIADVRQEARTHYGMCRQRRAGTSERPLPPQEVEMLALLHLGDGPLHSDDTVVLPPNGYP